jgi:hypothetical protein
MTLTMSRARPLSPRLRARLAGGLWVLVILLGVFAEMFVRATLIVRGDPAASAAAILANEQLFRLSFVADLVGAGAYVAATFLVYDLMKPVNRIVSLFSMLLGLAGSVIMIANLANLLGVLVYLKGGSYLASFGIEQRQALALTALKFHSLGYNIAMTVFAAQVLLLGWLILRSTFLPRILGWLFVIEWLCGWVRCLGVFLFPNFPDSLNDYLLMPSLIAEGGFALWLLVMGVNEARWREQTSSATREAAGA